MIIIRFRFISIHTISEFIVVFSEFILVYFVPQGNSACFDSRNMSGNADSNAPIKLSSRSPTGSPQPSQQNSNYNFNGWQQRQNNETQQRQNNETLQSAGIHPSPAAINQTAVNQTVMPSAMSGGSSRVLRRTASRSVDVAQPYAPSHSPSPTTMGQSGDNGNGNSGKDSSGNGGKSNGNGTSTDDYRY
jgi:hypothetical protein